MKRFLLFDSGCSLCSGLAADIAAASDGLLAARSLHDPELQATVKRVRPARRWEPTLLETDGEDARVFTGVALRARFLTVLGPRRAWSIAQLVAEAQTPLGTSPTNPAARSSSGAFRLPPVWSGWLCLGRRRTMPSRKMGRSRRVPCGSPGVTPGLLG